MLIAQFAIGHSLLCVTLIFLYFVPDFFLKSQKKSLIQKMFDSCSINSKTQLTKDLLGLPTIYTQFHRSAADFLLF